MAKKVVGTLRNLDQFLKQQPNQLVNVEKASAGSTDDQANEPEITLELLASLVEHLAEVRGESITQIVAEVISSIYENRDNPTAPEVMLQNTLLFLQHHEQTVSTLKNN